MLKQKIVYMDGDKEFEGYIATEEGGSKRPAVLVFPAWQGRDPFAENKAEALAKLGYVGCALDVYGKGILGKTDEENARLMDPLIEDRALLKRRILAGLQAVASLPFVDRSRVGALGFCFGGLCALDLARSGADVKGVVSFHGILTAPKEHPLPIKSKILVLHGHDDPSVKPTDVLAFEKEMTERKADWQVHIYSGTMHAFTNPMAQVPSLGRLYNPTADKRSWLSMKNFFSEIL